MSRDYSRKEVLDIIEREARERGIPREDFLRFAYIETGGAFDERASRGPHGAKGLFQFVPQTAAHYGIAGRELDPVANTDAAAKLYLDNQRDIIAGHQRTGHPYLSGKPQPNGLDMYLAHQQGAAGYRSVQAAITRGAFTRGDTRSHLLNNVSRRDIEAVTGVDFERFSRMSDQDMARTFVRYWATKFNRISIPEAGIGPAPTSPAAAPAPHDERHADPVTRGPIRLERAHQLSVQHNDVRYRLGSKSVDTGRIDCSGWVVMLQNTTMNEINAKAGRAVFTRDELFNPGMDAAATIVQKSAQRSGLLLEGARLTPDTLREGMVIGEDNGHTGFDAGRFRGIDHIVMVVRDPRSGQLMISQSRGGEGVELMPLDRYLRDKQSRGVRLFASDPLHEARALLDGHTPPSIAEHHRSEMPPARSVKASEALDFGDAGPAVACLQRRLFELGYHDRDGKPLRVDGTFGKDTLYALQQFQREHGLEGKGIAGPKTEAALRRAEASLMSDPSHPQHRLFEQALAKVQEAERARGIPVGPHSARIAGALVVEALREGLARIDRVAISDKGGLVWAIENRPGGRESGLGRTDGISLRQASMQPLAESTQQAQQVAVNVQARREDTASHVMQTRHDDAPPRTPLSPQPALVR